MSRQNQITHEICACSWKCSGLRACMVGWWLYCSDQSNRKPLQKSGPATYAVILTVHNVLSSFCTTSVTDFGQRGMSKAKTSCRATTFWGQTSIKRWDRFVYTATLDPIGSLMCVINTVRHSMVVRFALLQTTANGALIQCRQLWRENEHIISFYWLYETKL